jgi:hypothetical protein
MAIIDIYVLLIVFVINVIYTFFFYNKYALYVSNYMVLSTILQSSVKACKQNNST